MHKYKYLGTSKRHVGGDQDNHHEQLGNSCDDYTVSRLNRLSQIKRNKYTENEDGINVLAEKYWVRKGGDDGIWRGHEG